MSLFHCLFPRFSPQLLKPATGSILCFVGEMLQQSIALAFRFSQRFVEKTTVLFPVIHPPVDHEKVRFVLCHNRTREQNTNRHHQVDTNGGSGRFSIFPFPFFCPCRNNPSKAWSSMRTAHKAWRSLWMPREPDNSEQIIGAGSRSVRNLA